MTAIGKKTSSHCVQTEVLSDLNCKVAPNAKPIPVHHQCVVDNSFTNSIKTSPVPAANQSINGTFSSSSVPTQL